MNTPKLTFPTIHLNGTSRAELAAGYTAALVALQKAQAAIQQAGPNGRDYYPQGPDAIRGALREHSDRLVRLDAIMQELEALALHVVEG